MGEGGCPLPAHEGADADDFSLFFCQEDGGRAEGVVDVLPAPVGLGFGEEGLTQ